MKILRYVIAVAISIILLSPNADATPKRIIILRHGEKANGYALCQIGVERSLALAKNYLGEGSAKSLFEQGDSPAAFFAITLHTLELAAPASQTWQEPIIDYSSVPLSSAGDLSTQLLNERTREAATEVLTDHRWDGKTVVMVWEHKHIANAKLERLSHGNVTLRQLLHLDVFGKAVPKTWNGNNYDYFWIVDYGKSGSDIPTHFRTVRQVFPPPYQTVPSNRWKAPEGLPLGSGCKG